MYEFVCLGVIQKVRNSYDVDLLCLILLFPRVFSTTVFSFFCTTNQIQQEDVTKIHFLVFMKPTKFQLTAQIDTDIKLLSTIKVRQTKLELVPEK